MKPKALTDLALFFLAGSTLALAQVQTTAPSREELVKFLVKAKVNTYAGAGDNATVKSPLLPGTHQLEYSEGPFSYRDIYTGEAMFAGQEIVYYRGKPVWTMSYAGNIPADVSKDDVDALVRLLHKALMGVPAEIPYRGPRLLQDGAYTYCNRPEGRLDSFFGRETIARGDTVLYALVYGGGLVR
ncbi:MAG: DUF5680 domain-containing protein [Bryobacteraceae bacterium]|jgi:hypothetical protein